MNARDILYYGHDFVTRNLADLPMEHWETENVCGWWSTKLIIAHLASFEHMLVEVLTSFLEDDTQSPVLEQMSSLGGEGFNDYHIKLRREKTPAELYAEYTAVCQSTLDLVARLPEETLRQAGAIPWYGDQYALDDYIVYQYYGHKREHMAQVNIFKDTLKADGKLPGGGA
jgi:hypothetical protein